MLKDLHHKLIYATVEKAQLAENLREYRCELVIEEDLLTGLTNQWIKFKHKQRSDLSFKINLTVFKDPSTLMHVYKIQNNKFDLKSKIDKIGETVVEKPKKQFQFKQIDPEEDEEYIERRIDFGDSVSQSNSDEDSDDSDSERGIAPTEQVYKRAKRCVIDLLNKKQNSKLTNIAEINKILKTKYNIKIPESSTKDLVSSVTNKSKYFSLKPEYIEENGGEFEQKTKKKIKE